MTATPRRRTVAVAGWLCLCLGLAGGCARSGFSADELGASTTRPYTGPAGVDDLAATADSGVPRDPKGRPYLSPGDSGTSVATMQQRLQDIGATTTGPTGTYDDDTLRAVTLFQEGQGLAADGVVGTRTWSALDSPRAASAKAAPPPPDPAQADPSKSDSAALSAAAPPRPSGQARSAGPATKAVVSLGAQRVTLYDAGGTELRTFPVSSGKGALTPPGTFRVQRKSPLTRANSDAKVSMKWMTNFNGGIGFHGIPVRNDEPLATPLGVRPVSHGCVRMADADAKWVYDNLPNGSRVLVTR